MGRESEFSYIGKILSYAQTLDHCCRHSYTFFFIVSVHAFNVAGPYIKDWIDDVVRKSDADMQFIRDGVEFFIPYAGEYVSALVPSTCQFICWTVT